jgi:hypothetical protein
MVQAPGADLNKLFSRKLTHSLCKLDLYIAMQQILLTFMKWPRLKKSLGKFMPIFYEIDPYKKIYSHNLQIFVIS